MREKKTVKITDDESLEAIKRIEQWVGDNEIAIVSAWRGHPVNLSPMTDIPSHISHKPKMCGENFVAESFAEDEPFSAEEKKYNIRALKALLLSYGYGIATVKGKWMKDLSNGESTDEEESFFVVNINDDPSFKSKIFNLSEKLDLGAFTYSPLGSNVGYVIGTNAASWPGYGNTIPFGEFTPNIIEQARTSIKNGNYIPVDPVRA